MNLTPKQEAFSRKYIETGNASEAYRSAYNAEKMKDTTIWRKAKEVMDNGKVSARIHDLQKTHQKKHDVSVELITKMHLKAYAVAIEKENPSAMTNATQNLAKVHGLIVERKANTDTEGNDKIEKMIVEYTFIDANIEDKIDVSGES